LAAGILYPALGLLLNPMIAAAATSFSSVSVIANALRLRSARHESSLETGATRARKRFHEVTEGTVFSAT
jgi:hypothetical protein